MGKFEQALKNYAEYVIKKAKENLAKGGKYGTQDKSGVLSNSLSYKINKSKVSFLSENYGAFQDQGVRGSKSTYPESRTSDFKFTNKMPPSSVFDISLFTILLFSSEGLKKLNSSDLLLFGVFSRLGEFNPFAKNSIPIGSETDKLGDSEIFNVGLDNANMTKIQLCDKIKEYIPNFNYYVSDGEDPDQRNYFVSTSKLTGIGFSPKLDIEYGIKQIMEIYPLIKDYNCNQFTNLR